jgi:hypothetical protein
MAAKGRLAMTLRNHSTAARIPCRLCHAVKVSGTAQTALSMKPLFDAVEARGNH